MFRQVFLCVWKRRSRPGARETGGRRASLLARPPGPANGLTAGTRPILEAVQRGCSVGDGLSGMMLRSWHHRLAGGEGKRSDSLSRSLTGRRLPNAALSRACANYGCKAHGRGCRVRGPSGPRQAHAIGTAEPARRAAAVRCVSDRHPQGRDPSGARWSDGVREPLAKLQLSQGRGAERNRARSRPKVGRRSLQSFLSGKGQVMV